VRFLADGPAIPDDLLVARDEGRVIFFCGAGVSQARAGLSDFFGLAQKVVDFLGVGSNDAARKIIEAARDVGLRTGVSGLISADQIFGLLERDFFPRDIEAAVVRTNRLPLIGSASSIQPCDLENPVVSATFSSVDRILIPSTHMDSIQILFRRKSNQTTSTQKERSRKEGGIVLQ